MMKKRITSQPFQNSSPQNKNDPPALFNQQNVSAFIIQNTDDSQNPHFKNNMQHIPLDKLETGANLHQLGQLRLVSEQRVNHNTSQQFPITGDYSQSKYLKQVGVNIINEKFQSSQKQPL
ncbi:UNKNOWN [Stylonychia lemnae]|uniref:Uncharacterized protein n=1 Tax=Stylonychia lemnae TaxID=5949 RepID=A0A078AXA9_STYLE|nr:UNKNOWN [Stylonychia lemnae]|eukprot:CDW86809.1 UNKNOWN [Stylonychia lemnae]